jgi:hypothetical protein
MSEPRTPTNAGPAAAPRERRRAAAIVARYIQELVASRAEESAA